MDCHVLLSITLTVLECLHFKKYRIMQEKRISYSCTRTTRYKTWWQLLVDTSVCTFLMRWTRGKSFKPFMKPNNKLLYVHRQSNHPPALLKTFLKISTEDYQAFHRPNRVSTKLLPLTKKHWTKADTTPSSPMTHRTTAQIRVHKTARELAISNGTTLLGIQMSKPTSLLFTYLLDVTSFIKWMIFTSRVDGFLENRK